MANDLTLQSTNGHPVDQHLRPVKIGGEITGLEISKNAVRISGDFEVNGDIGTLNLSCINIGPISSNEKFCFSENGTPFAELWQNNGGNLSLGSADGTGDNFTIQVIQNALTAIATTNAAGASGHLLIEADGYVDIGSTGANNITLDSAQDIELNADGGTVTIKDATASHFLFDCDNTMLRIYDDTDAADFFSIIVGASGATTVSTYDAGATVGHLTLDADGDIKLDSASGGFVAKKAGTEFSVEGSAYAGMILGYTTVGIDAADDSYTLTASFAVTDSAHKVKFVAPPSGVVEIFVSIFADTARRFIHLGLSDNATYNTLDVTHEHDTYVPGGTLDELQINHYWVITGLTAGTAYEYWLGAKITVGTGGVLRWGGNVTGEYAPFIMKATALPAATADFAVYD